MIFVKKESENLILFNLKKGLFLSLFSIAVLYFLIPFSDYALISDSKLFAIKELTDKNSLITYENRFLFIIISVFLPMSITFLTFRYYYLNNERAIKIRNLVSRKNIFLNNLISSLILTLMPFIFIWIVTLFFPFSNFIPYGIINQFFIKCIVFELFIFSIS